MCTLSRPTCMLRGLWARPCRWGCDSLLSSRSASGCSSESEQQPPTRVAAVTLKVELGATHPPDPTPLPSSTTLPSPSPSPSPAPTDTKAPPSTIAPTSTATAIPSPTLTPSATATPTPGWPRVIATAKVNLRSGPGRAYPIIGSLAAGQVARIAGRNEAGDWWQVERKGKTTAWVAGSVVEALGPTGKVAVVKDVPAPPPSATATRQAATPQAATPQAANLPPL